MELLFGCKVSADQFGKLSLLYVFIVLADLTVFSSPAQVSLARREKLVLVTQKRTAVRLLGFIFSRRSRRQSRAPYQWLPQRNVLLGRHFSTITSLKFCFTRDVDSCLLLNPACYWHLERPLLNKGTNEHFRYVLRSGRLIFLSWSSALAGIAREHFKVLFNNLYERYVNTVWDAPSSFVKECKYDFIVSVVIKTF